MNNARAWLTRAVLLIGSATFIALLWSLGPARIAEHLLAFGWGFLLVMPFQIFDHMLNAIGWRLSFSPENARKTKFWNLVYVRIAGDGVNYLTPSANIAGEFVRPGMLKGDLSEDEKISSVLVAKATQSVGQALFVLIGLAYLLHGHFVALSSRRTVIGALGMVGILLGVATGIILLLVQPPQFLELRYPKLFRALAPIRARVRIYIGGHPCRMGLSTAFFMLGYTWGAAEVWLIARLMGLHLTAAMSMSIEFLSNLVDALAFMVPAKIGTQEAGKTAIFAGLGLAAEMGFTLGIIRHVREVCWAGLGLLFYGRHKRKMECGSSGDARLTPREPAEAPRARAG